MTVNADLYHLAEEVSVIFLHYKVAGLFFVVTILYIYIFNLVAAMFSLERNCYV